MSVAEKLKRLEYTSLDRRSLGYALAAALPEIIAVVRAAEQIAFSVRVRSEVLPSALRAESEHVCSALSALDEKL